MKTNKLTSLVITPEELLDHRGQGYIYLRSLGIGPPYFWER